MQLLAYLVLVALASLALTGIECVNKQVLGIDLSHLPVWKQAIHQFMPALLGIVMAFAVKQVDKNL